MDKIKSLLNILTYKRCHGSESEQQFCSDYFGDFDSIKDKHGEVMAYTYKVDDAPVLWSCHVDTVHGESGNVQVLFDELTMLAYTDGTTQLGADDGVGVWLLREMMNAGVPGTYVFHRGEEKGGIGSSFLAEYHEEFLSKFNYAIAFDRKGDKSVITHQMQGRGCSDAFGLALAQALNNHGLQLELDRTGVFTDTALYFGIIPECTNVSCGYQGEHTYAEAVDVEYVLNLRDALIKAFSGGIDLPVERTPTTDFEDDYDFGFFNNHQYGKFDKPIRRDLELTELADMSIDELEDFCYHYPSRAASTLFELLGVIYEPTH